ncbi:multiubiquitin domain-containing protein [uncultured Christiangramia sp.]|uniref:multiubiquitin domain-containing protein n=1 Tax=Christiangramia sp. 3-2217-3z TaxID=3417564 RepID=UPI002618535D|nr:multiubiquitin domain-containing protein [uncultured Christiangramia sp.]
MSQPEKTEKFKIMVDQKPFEVENKFITGSEIKVLVSAPANYGVWLKVNGPGDDIEIENNEKIDLSDKGREHFFTGAKTTTEG